MRVRSLLGAGLLAFSILGIAPAFAGPELGQREIEESLTCQCGCGLTVHTCNHLQCGFAVPVRKDIAESLARGETGEQILERYKIEYGEKVLSSPIAEGFNILAWIAPYLAIVLAGGGMLLFFRQRSRRAAAPAGAVTGTGPASPELDERRARLREEVKELQQ